MRLPDFIIIGAAKSGTTSLFKLLEKNNDIYLSTPKEPEYFARDDVYSNGVHWYSELFSGSNPEQLCCEASTIYSLTPLFPDTAKRMHDALPSVKLVYIMRDPVKRAYSYYVQLMKNYQNCYKTTEIPISFEAMLFETNSNALRYCSPYLAQFDKHLPYGPDLITAGGMYMRQINEYLRFYERSSMHFIIFENFITNPVDEMVKLYNFLGLSSDSLSQNYSEARENISSDHFNSLATVNIIEKVKSIPLMSGLMKLLPVNIRIKTRGFIESIVRRGDYAKKIIPLKMEQETMDYLVELYKEPTRELSAFLEEELSSLWSIK